MLRVTNSSIGKEFVGLVCFAVVIPLLTICQYSAIGKHTSSLNSQLFVKIKIY